MRGSVAEGYTKGDVINNYYVQVPHIHLCTCWYYSDISLLLLCVLFSRPSVPFPVDENYGEENASLPTCSNAFCLLGLRTEGSHYFSS